MGKQGNLKRQMEAELAPIRKTALFISAGVCVVFGILFALTGVDRYVYFCTLQPRCRLSPFFSVVLWIVALAVYGASAALLLARRRGLEKRSCEVGILAVSAPILCYVWLPVVYKAASFLLATLLVAVILFCMAALFSNACRRSRIAALGFALFSVWMLYILYYSFALFLLNCR